jgi:fibronectin type 3 domain-containing protein
MQDGLRTMVLIFGFKKIIIMKKIIFTIVLLLSFSVKSQEIKLFGESVNGKIQLKWMSKKLFNDSSYDILRNDGNGNWQKINSSPIIASEIISVAELKSSKNKYPNDKSYKFYIETKNTKEKDVNKQAYADYQLSIGAIFDNQLAKHMGIYFQDDNVEAGKNYSYKLVDAKSQKEISVLNNIKAGEISPAPEKVEINQEKQNVKLIWKNNENFFGYNIYRNGSKINEEPIFANLENNIYSVSYVDQKLPEGNYNYVIKGITFLNTESKPSNGLNFSVKDLTPPLAVKGTKAERKDNIVTISWIQTNDKEVVGYNVLRSDDNGKFYKKITAQPLKINDTKYNDRFEETVSGTFYYKIETIDSNGNSTTSNNVSILVPDHFPPSKPVDLISRVQPGKILLSWKPNSEKDLAGYRIYRGLKDDDENEMLLLNVAPQKEANYTDIFNEKAGTKFIYKVVAIDNSFNESPKSSLWVQLPDVIAPQAPVLKEAVIENGKVNIKWDEVLTDKILGYDVYRIYNSKEEKITSQPVKSNLFSDEVIKRGIIEYFIKAVDSAKLESKPSNKIAITTADDVANQLRLVINQDLRTKKLNLKIEGVKPDEVQEIKLFKKTGKSGFVRTPFKLNPDGFLDEETAEGEIYEYYVEVITIDDAKLKSEKVVFNNY